MINDSEDRVQAFGKRQFVQKKTDNSGQTEDLSRPLKTFIFLNTAMFEQKQMKSGTQLKILKSQIKKIK